MKRSYPSRNIGSIFALLACAAASTGCNPSNNVTPGSPVLVNLQVVTPAGAAAELVTEGGAAEPVPPLSYVYALFDRLLDPAGVAALDSDGGVLPKNGAVTATWSGGNIATTVAYMPNGDYKRTLIPAGFFSRPFGVGPSLTIVPNQGGWPSAATVTVTLNPAMVRSHDQLQPFVAAADVLLPLVFQTDSLQVTTDAPVPVVPDGGADDGGGAVDGGDGGATVGPPPPVDPTFVLHITFNNATPTTTAGAILVTAAVGGAPVAGLAPVIKQDPMNPAVWTVTPPDPGWPAGATVTVTVAAAATDTYQVALGTDTAATFTVTQ